MKQQSIFEPALSPLLVESSSVSVLETLGKAHERQLPTWNLSDEDSKRRGSWVVMLTTYLSTPPPVFLSPITAPKNPATPYP